MALAGCATVLPRFEPDVQAAVVRDEMRVLETAQLVLYYPAPRQAEARRVAARLEACVAALEAQAPVGNGLARARYHVVLPEVPFNNAYVFPKALGIEDVAVITGDTLDFVTEFGLPPDSGHHRLPRADPLRAPAADCQLFRGCSTRCSATSRRRRAASHPWFLEGLATTYEAALARRGPAALAGVHEHVPRRLRRARAGLRGDSLSEYGRMATPGHQYLVGAMFVGWLLDTYGEAALCRLARRRRPRRSCSASTVASTTSTARASTSRWPSSGRHVARRFPRRARPAGEAIVRRLGTDSRWAWAPDGSTAIVDEDVDRPPRLTVRNPDGSVIAEVKLVEIGPQPALVMGGALLTTGLGFTGDSQALYLTALDLGATTQTTRLFRFDLDGDGRLVEVARDLGSGGAIAPDGGAYYALSSDGDRWSAIAYDLATRQRRTVWAGVLGQYALRVAVAPDGRQLAVSVWDGARWAIWIFDAASGARRPSSPAPPAAPGPYDAAFAPDGGGVPRRGRRPVPPGGGGQRRWRPRRSPTRPTARSSRGCAATGCGSWPAMDGGRRSTKWRCRRPTRRRCCRRAPRRRRRRSSRKSTRRGRRRTARTRGSTACRRPRLRAPTLFATTGSTAIGVALAGGDRRATCAGAARPTSTPRPSR